MYRVIVSALVAALVLAACAGGASQDPSPQASPVVRHGFLGAFFRPVGTPPFGVFSAYSKQRAPDPYPTPGSALSGPRGYCDAPAANGLSISSGYQVDARKLSNIVELGVKWTRTAVSSNYADQSHIFGPGRYAFADFDSAQCALVRRGIVPVAGIEGGTVQYNTAPDQYSPAPVNNYKTAADFGQWCGVVARHETQIFPQVTRYSIPGNEVNSDPKTWSGGDAQIPLTQACYRAIKAVAPKSVVYGFEINMDKRP